MCPRGNRLSLGTHIEGNLSFDFVLPRMRRGRAIIEEFGMKKLTLVLLSTAAFSGSALAADLPARTYTKAPVMPEPVANWTGFYVFGGGGGGIWDAKTNLSSFPGGISTRDIRTGGNGWFGTVGAGYDWQFNRSWVAGVFADGQFGSISGSLVDVGTLGEGSVSLRNTWAAGVRLGYLVAPNALSYVNAGYTGSSWSGVTLNPLVVAGAGPSVSTVTPSFNRDGFFIGGGVENSLNFFGITAPGWFMKTEYRAAYFGRASLSETVPTVPGVTIGETFKPLVQTVSTSLVYRFDSGGMPASAPAHMYAKAPIQSAANWTGFYVFGGAGGGIWEAKGNESATQPGSQLLTRDLRTGGDGWFGTVGAGYDWQFSHSWVAGVFADGQFGSLRGSLTDLLVASEGSETLRNSWAAGVRLGYLVAPNVLSYVNAGYSGSQWSGASITSLIVTPPATAVLTTTPSFSRDGFFVGGGVENSLNFFGITAPGWFMKTEYRAAYYGRVTLPETIVVPTPPAGLSINETFKPWVQTISTSLVYRFNSPVVAKY